MGKIRIGHGYDVHRLAEGLTFTLGGITIEHHKGCVAHSDGDVALHALCDAMLGAAALGDIGLHFPDTSDDWKGADSCDLLRRTVRILRDAGWRTVNADITIALQSPKIRPYIDTMRERIAKSMDVGVADISVKATTTERLGFVGREEGVEAHAVVLIEEVSE